MLSESTMKDLPETAVEKTQDPRDKLKEDREHVMLARENQAQALKDSVQLFIEESNERSARNEKKIVELRARISKSPQDFTAICLSKVEELEQKNLEMKKKLSEYKLESRGRWISFKHEYNHDMLCMEKALNTFVCES